MTGTSDDSAEDEPSDFWLWTDIVLAGCFVILLIDRVTTQEWAWAVLGAVLVVWQGRKAVRAIRELSARRKRPSDG